MPFIEWSDSFNTGHNAIDDDHRALFRLVNDLHDHNNSDTEEETFDKAINALADYIHSHFEREEALLEAADYSELELHKQAHARLRMRLLGYQVAFQANPLTFDRQAFVRFVTDWLSAHILETDMAYVPHLNSHKAA